MLCIVVRRLSLLRSHNYARMSQEGHGLEVLDDPSVGTGYAIILLFPVYSETWMIQIIQKMTTNDNIILKF